MELSHQMLLIADFLRKLFFEHYYLGYYYLLAIENPALKAEAKANKDKSIEYWNKILAIDPANATAKRALDGIK